MQNKKKIMAVGAAALVGIAGYGVYATTLTISSTNAFSAGTGVQTDGCLAGQPITTTLTPVLEGTTWVANNVVIEGAPDSFTTCAAGTTMTVQALDAEKNVISKSGMEEISSDTHRYKVKIDAAKANSIAYWAVLVNGPASAS